MSLNPLETAKASLAAKQAALQEKKTQRQRQSDALSEAQAALQALEAQERAAEGERQALRQQSDALRRQLESLQSQNSALRAELAGVFALAFGKKKELKARIDENEAAQAKARADQRGVEEKLAGLPGAQASERRAELSARVAAGAAALAALERDIPALQAAVDALEAEVAGLEAEAVAARAVQADEAAPVVQTDKTAPAVQTDNATPVVQADEPAPAVQTDEPAPAVASPSPSPAPSKPDRRLEGALARLEALYPEHQVFALSNVDESLRERLSGLYRQLGYGSVEALLRDNGYTVISGEAARRLRPSVTYRPGNEPDAVREQVRSIQRRLAEYYPDKVISRGVMGEHKALANDLSGMAAWLGYEDTAAFLAAYGYRYEVNNVGGRPSTDFDSMLAALKAKYAAAPVPKTIGALIFENPDYAARIKTLQNRCQEIYGVPARQFFLESGLITGKGDGGASAPAGARKGVPGGPGAMELAAYSALEALYQRPEAAAYGSYESARAQLAGIVIKQSKGGSIYVFKGTDCPEDVTLPYGIDSIKAGAFSGALRLRRVTLPPTLKELPADCFANCPALERVTFSDELEAIGERAFSGCGRLNHLSLPAGLWNVGSRAFANCPNLTDVRFAGGTVRLPADAFEGSPYHYEAPAQEDDSNAALFECALDKRGSVTILRYNGRETCVQVPAAISGRPVKAIGKGAFAGNRTLEEVTFADEIASMQGQVFQDCAGLKRVHLPNAMTSLMTTLFNGCTGLEEVNIPDGVTEIKRATFKDSPLKALHIGKGLRTFSSKPFYNGEYSMMFQGWLGSRALTTITVDPENPYLSAQGASVLTRDGRTLLAFMGGEPSARVPEGVEIIAPYAFEHLTNLSDVALPESLVEVGESAFSRSELRSVQFGPNLRVIRRDAFSYCDGLSAVILPEGLEELEERAFIGCPITSVLLPSTLRRLGGDCFTFSSFNHPPLKDFRVAEGNPWMQADGDALYETVDGEKTLVRLYGLRFAQKPTGLMPLAFLFQKQPAEEEYAVVPGTVNIADGAFRDCVNLKAVYLPDGVKRIGAAAFMNCDGLEAIDLPDGLESIGAEAFRGTELSDIALPASVTSVGEGAFVTGREGARDPSPLQSLTLRGESPVFTLEDGLLLETREDGTRAVAACAASVEVVRVPEGVSEIRGHAFERCAVREIHIPASVRALGEKAFFACPQLTHLHITYPEADNGLDHSIIYLPTSDGDTGNMFTQMSVRDQVLDCIRFDIDGNLFDFVKYDSLFETIESDEDRAMVAVDRLKSAYHLAPLYAERYLEWLQRNPGAAVASAVQHDDVAGLETLKSLGVFTGENISLLIALATEAGKTEITAWLLAHKNQSLGGADDDLEL